MSTSRGRILVLDGDQAAALAVVRSLGRAGHAVEVADCVADPLAGRSRFALARHRCPPPKLEPEAFIAWLETMLRAGSFELVVPVTDDSLQPIAKERERLESGAILAVAPEPGLVTFTDKDRTFELARELGVPLPEGRRVTSPNELEAALASAVFPVVVKPTRSLVEGEGGLRSALSVRYARDRAELARLGGEALKHGPVLLQERVAGEGVGVEVLCDRGEVVASFQHRRLHEWPLTGGGSSYRESVAVEDGLLEDARKLMRATAYHGVAMVEFKCDRGSGRHHLMEVNARFWGSLPLGVCAGANFPLWLRDLLVEGKRPEATDYRSGIRCRKFSRDLFWSVEVLRRSDPDPLVDWPPRWQGLLTWFGVLLPSHRFDVQSFTDLGPGWLDLKRSFALLFERFFARRRRLAMLRKMESLRRARGPLEERIRKAGKIVILCYGNINRSAIAAADLVGRLAGDELEILGAGLHQREGRPADPLMLALLDEVGLDLKEHRSHRLRDRELEEADLVLAMDSSQLTALAERHPEALEKVFLYGVLDDEPSVEIADPYGGDEAAYRAARDRLIALGAVLARLRAGP